MKSIAKKLPLIKVMHGYVNEGEILAPGADPGTNTLD